MAVDYKSARGKTYNFSKCFSSIAFFKKYLGKRLFIKRSRWWTKKVIQGIKGYRQRHKTRWKTKQRIISYYKRKSL